jgi:hypothetical protein
MAVPEGDGPIGKWPAHISVWGYIGLNQSGRSAFTVTDRRSGKHLGAFLWDPETRKSAPVALPGSPAADDLTFGEVGARNAAINNHDEVAFTAQVKNAAGRL